MSGQMEALNLGEIAARRDEGESVASLAAEYRVNESTLCRHLTKAGLDPEPNKPPHDEVVARYKEGESAKSIAQDFRDRNFRISEQEVARILDAHDIPRLRRRRVFPLSQEDLAEIAKLHNEGKGTSITTLARDYGVSPKALKRELLAAGYTVFTREGRPRRRPKEVEGNDSLDSPKSDQPQGDEPTEEAAVAVPRTPVRPNPPEPVWRKPPKPFRPDYSDPRWNAIAGREEELATRILDGDEPVRDIAQELGVNQNWLSIALKKTGHLPDANLSRWRKQKRRNGETT